MIELAGKGGIFHYTASLISGMPSDLSISLYTGDPCEIENWPSNVRVHKVFRRNKTNPIVLARAVWGIIKDRPSAVHLQLSQGAGLILLLAFAFRLASLRVVTTVHNVLPHEPSKLSNLILRFVYSLSDRLIVHSSHCKALMDSQFGTHFYNKTVVLDHGNYLLLSKHEVASVTPPIFTILFFGFIRPYKGLDVLIDACGLLRKDFKSFRLLIVGRPVESFDRYQDRIEVRRIADYTETVLEYVPLSDIPLYFGRASCVILPYLDASQSGVLQLAYAFGKPVVVSRVGGLPESVEEGRSGMIFSAGDAVDLARCLTTLMESQELVDCLGIRARQLSETKFSWKTIGLRTCEIYQGKG